MRKKINRYRIEVQNRTRRGENTTRLQNRLNEIETALDDALTEEDVESIEGQLDELEDLMDDDKGNSGNGGRGADDDDESEEPEEDEEDPELTG